jgi:hypothetical protein
MWNIVSVRLEILLVSVQERCTVCAKCTIRLEIFLDALDGTLRLRGSSRKLISVRLEIVLILTQIGARFAPNVPQPHKSFWTYLMELLCDVSHVESCFGPFGDSVSVGAR